MTMKQVDLSQAPFKPHHMPHDSRKKSLCSSGSAITSFQRIKSPIVHRPDSDIVESLLFRFIDFGIQLPSLPVYQSYALTSVHCRQGTLLSLLIHADTGVGADMIDAKDNVHHKEQGIQGTAPELPMGYSQVAVMTDSLPHRTCGHKRLLT